MSHPAHSVGDQRRCAVAWLDWPGTRGHEEVACSAAHTSGDAVHALVGEEAIMHMMRKAGRQRSVRC
jgi:hypothetical protein